MNRYLPLVEESLAAHLPSGRPAKLFEAVRYAVGSGGKRIRPSICMAAAEAVGGSARDAVCPAAAIEFLHNYTLVHDDLPAMDDDRVRRGNPTVWVKYGEAMAILAGDALLTQAFKVAAQTPKNAAGIVRVLAERGTGVVAGQVADLDSVSGKAAVGEEDARFVYERKTGDLFVAAAVTGAMAAGAGESELHALARYALDLGLAFQLQDDLLDGDGLYPPGRTRELADEKTTGALAALRDLPGDVSALEAIAVGLTGRKI